MRVSSAMAAVSLAILAFGESRVLAAPVSLTIDTDHSSVGFSVRHLFTRVPGIFRQFNGSFVFDEAHPSKSSVNATIQAASIDTNLEARDKDLRSNLFLDVEQFPTLTFASKSVKKASAKKFLVAGTLTVHGVSKEVVLDTEFFGKGKDPWGNMRFGFRATTTVNRKDYGMQWNKILETGGVLVGEQVEITLDIDGIVKE